MIVLCLDTMPFCMIGSLEMIPMFERTQRAFNFFDLSD